MRRELLLVGLALILLMASAVQATVPRILHYQGRLTDGSDNPQQGTYDFTFRLYAAESGGGALWTEVHNNIATDSDGLYQLNLGEITSLNAISFDTGYWLSVQIDAGGEMTPRQRLLSTAYAVRADLADSIAAGVFDDDWTVAENNVYTTAKNIGINGANPGDSLTVTGTVSISDTLTVGDTVTAAFFVGNGANLTGLPSAAVTAYTNSTDNRVITSVDGNTVNGEANLTFDGATLGVTDNLAVSNRIDLGGDTFIFRAPDGSLYIGRNAGRADAWSYGAVAGDSNMFIGYNAGAANTTGYQNLALGVGAGQSNVTGLQNVYIGFLAGRVSTSDGNTFIGSNAGYDNDAGERNTLIGCGAAYNQSGANADRNTVVGMWAGYFNLGNDNTFLGEETGYSNSSGDYNTFLGRHAGFTNNMQHYNTYVGYKCGYSTRGQYNAYLGYYTGYGAANAPGSYNTFIGVDAGRSINAGNSNTCLGYQAGYSNANGDSNVFIGPQAGYNETGSNKFYLQCGSSDTPLIYGEFDNDLTIIYGKLGIDTTPAYPLALGSGAHVTAGGVWTDASSRSFKENISNLTYEEAAAILAGMDPVRYNYRREPDEQYLGFIAEEVPEAVAMTGRQGLSPMDFVAVLTKVVQEQQQRIDALSARLRELEGGRE